MWRLLSAHSVNGPALQFKEGKTVTKRNTEQCCEIIEYFYDCNLNIQKTIQIKPRQHENK